MTSKYYIGPMSKNIVDAIIDFCESTNNQIGLIPSRRQVENTGGYVNNWTTKEFSEYVRSKSKNIILKRDHAGPGQGLLDDDGYESLSEDCKYLDLIHIDPWKKYPLLEEGLKQTVNMINYCHNLNPDVEYEVGTEEAIRRFGLKELDYFVSELQNRLRPEVFHQIKHLVIQSGTSLKGNNQTGEYNSTRLKAMIDIGKKYNLLTKEHNGDYIPVDTINGKFKLGLDAINIAPEFGLIETQTYLDQMEENSDVFNQFYQLCYDSKRWVKWVNDDFDPIHNKTDLIKISGHYVLSNPEFKEIKQNYPNIDNVIKQNVIKKLNSLYGYHYVDTRPKTIFCDIDGTLVTHHAPTENTKFDVKLELLEGTVEKLTEWDAKGYNIILTTGRKESMRAATEKQLSEVGIFYNQLIMGIGGGPRILINDNKPNGAEYASAINIERNKGIKDIQL